VKNTPYINKGQEGNFGTRHRKMSPPQQKKKQKRVCVPTDYINLAKHCTFVTAALLTIHFSLAPLATSRHLCKRTSLNCRCKSRHRSRHPPPVDLQKASHRAYPSGRGFVWSPWQIQPESMFRLWWQPQRWGACVYVCEHVCMCKKGMHVFTVSVYWYECLLCSGRQVCVRVCDPSSCAK